MNPLYLAIPIWAVGALLTFAFFTYSFWKSRTGEATIEYNPMIPRQEQFLILLFAFLALVWPVTLAGTKIYWNKDDK